MLSYEGLTSIGISITQLLEHDETSVQEIIHFQREYLPSSIFLKFYKDITD